jgi:hypothetical protein
MDTLATVTALQELAATYQTARHPVHYGHSTDRTIISQIERIAEKRATYDSDLNQISDAIYHVLRYACPIVSPDNPELLAIFADPKHIETGRRTTGKPGKLLGKLLPGATAKEKESFAVWWKETIILPRDGLTVKETTDGDIIGDIYKGTLARSSDPSLTSRGWKSLSASCMRHSFDELPQHPATVYGTGDFKLFWVENSAQHIAARVIVAIRNGRFVPGPIYCNSNAAGDILEKHIAQEKEKERDGDSVDSDSWINCRLERIEHNGGFIAPYLDIYQSVKDTGSFLKICSSANADIELNDTSGIVYAGGAYQCSECDDRIDEDSAYHDDNGNCYCEYCYSQRFTTCEHCYETTAHDDMVTIQDWRGRGVDCACEHCVNNGDIDCVRIDGAYYELDSVVFDSDDNAHVSDSGTYFVSDLTGETHDIEQEHTLPNGDSCTMGEAVETGNWIVKTERVFKCTVVEYDGNHIERYTLVPRLVLQHWLELDSDGDVINRQPMLLNCVALPGVECDSDESPALVWRNKYELELTA